MNKVKLFKKLVLLLFVFLILLVPSLIFGANGLEVNYPTLPGGEEASSDLSQYLTYLYEFSFYILGFVLIGTLVYNGVIYITSVGDPGKKKNALGNLQKSGVGVVLVLSSFLLLRAINPGLVNPAINEIEETETTLNPGIYLCNYKINNIDSLLNKYLNTNEEIRRKGAKELKLVLDPGEEDKGCLLFNNSVDDIDNKIFNLDQSNHTIFSLPKRMIKEDEVQASYDYGVMLHELEDYKGRAFLYPNSKINSSSEYYKPDNYAIDYGGFDFTPSSATVFKKTSFSEEEKEKARVTIYSKTAYTTESEEEGEDAPHEILLSEIGDDNDFQKSFLLEDIDGGIYENNVRSIRIYPSQKLLAFLFPKDVAQDFDKSYSFEDTILRDEKEKLYPLIITRSKSDLTDFLPLELSALAGRKERKPLLSSILIIPGSKQ